jgi:integrase
MKYYIGERIHPDHWNKRACRAKETKAFPQFDLFNQRLCHIENVVQDLLIEFKFSGDLCAVDMFRQELNSRISQRNIVEEKCRKNLFFFIEEFINEAEKLKAVGTVRQYKNTFRLLQDYAKKVHRLDFHNIDMRFYANFKNYMDREGHSEAYFSNQIKYIRLFMNEATDRGYNEHVLYRSKKFVCPQVLTDKIYLTSKEVTRIQHTKLSGAEKLERARDVFIVACHTGLRFSDLVQLQPFNFDLTENILRVRTQKTAALVYIPLSPEVLNICKKYNFRLPHFCNSSFNACIKEIARQAGLVETVELFVAKGNRKVRLTMPKYQLITSHTARRSFATNAFLAGVPNISIMQITGHTTEKAFMRYIRVSGEDNARRMLRHPHFSKK